MIFNSFSYAIFLPIVFIIYWSVPHRFRWGLILVASYYFYMSWNVKYVLLILFTTIISYGAGIILEAEKRSQNKKIILSVTAVLCLGVLFIFKYFNFVSESIVNLANLFSIRLNSVTLKLILPVGISFYTFQTLSYVIDVYKGIIPAEHHFGYYAAFISFFPQLVAEPIERTSNLLPQIKNVHSFNYDKATYGLKLMAWGYFKKIVIADALSVYVSSVYDTPQSYQGFALILATIFFSFQIYCDFSGYSDIAIGTAKLLDIDLMVNFRSPYFSKSIGEFWDRWHISLSTWFRDYVYIPLGGNRCSKIRHYFNLLITFLASGLWHGANSTFVLWGGVHGVAQVIEKLIFSKLKSRKDNNIVRGIKVLTVFCFCSFAWIFFVSNSLEDAGYVIGHLFTGITSPITYLIDGIWCLIPKKVDLLITIISLMLLVIYDFLSIKNDVIYKISEKKGIVRWTTYTVFIIWIIVNIPSNNSSEFIYFQF